MDVSRVAQLAFETPATWEEGDCPLCSSPRWRPWLEAAEHATDRRYLLVRCNECDLCFTNPRPVFTPTPISPRPAHESSALASWGRRLPGRNNWRHALPPHGQKRLLDVGYGDGAFLTRMRTLGWQAVGIHLEALVLAQLPSESFDQITFWDTLGMSAEPLQTLRTAWRILAPTGRLIVRTANLESWGVDWFSSAWQGLDVPRQQVHFAPASLRAGLLRAGFRQIRIRMLRRPAWLKRSAQRIGGLGLLRTQLAAQLVSWTSLVARRGEVLLASARKA